MKVKLDQVLEAVVLVGDGNTYYYHKPTNEIVCHFDPLFFGDENQELEVDLDENFDQYILLPSSYDINNYRIMERFILTLPEGKIQESLERAIQGKGAFRKFRDLTNILGISEDWYEFQNNAHKEIAIEWCREHEIEYEEN